MKYNDCCQSQIGHFQETEHQDTEPQNEDVIELEGGGNIITLETEDEFFEEEDDSTSWGRNKQINLKMEVEHDLAEWVQENQFLYDRGMMEYKNKFKKMQVLTEKAESLMPPFTRQQLQRWIHRTHFGRLTREQQKSGPGAKKPRAERDRWILQLFNFMGRHIVRPKTSEWEM